MILLTILLTMECDVRVLVNMARVFQSFVGLSSECEVF